MVLYTDAQYICSLLSLIIFLVDLPTECMMISQAVRRIVFWGKLQFIYWFTKTQGRTGREDLKRVNSRLAAPSNSPLNVFLRVLNPGGMFLAHHYHHPLHHPNSCTEGRGRLTSNQNIKTEWSSYVYCTYLLGKWFSLSKVSVVSMDAHVISMKLLHFITNTDDLLHNFISFYYLQYRR